jgi:hypothetical protein
LATLLPRLAEAEPAEPEAPNLSPNWSPEILISTNSPNGAIQPAIKAAPDGHTVTIVYSAVLSGGDHDVYYSQSSDYGQPATWSSPQPIHNSAGGADSLQVRFAYDASNVAHAVWREGNALFYKRGNNWGNNNTGAQTLSNPTEVPGASNPDIVASGSATLDVIWSEGALPNEPNPNIYHKRSINGGAIWSAKKHIYEGPPTSEFPSLVIAQSGQLHAVWQENLITGAVIYYSQGTPSGANVTWSLQPIAISNRSGATSARQPQITARGNTLHVSYTDYISQDQQAVHHLQCSSQCVNINQWIPTNNPVSGPFVGANPSNPFNVVSTITSFRGCTLVYFHGTVSDLPKDKEIIWGVNSCDGWSASVRDQVTATQVRAINPSIVTQNDWWLYLTYEQAETIRQVYFVRSKPDVYLPTIARQ